MSEGNKNSPVVVPRAGRQMDITHGWMAVQKWELPPADEGSVGRLNVPALPEVFTTE